MKYLLSLAALIAGSIVPFAASAETSIGWTTISIPSPQRGKPLSVDVWYPSDAKAPETLVGDNRIFTGAPAKPMLPSIRANTRSSCCHTVPAPAP